MDCDRGSPIFCKPPNGNHNEHLHQPLTSAATDRHHPRLPDKTNTISNPTDFRSFFNTSNHHDHTVIANNCLQAPSTPLEMGIHTLASTPIHSATFLPTVAEDSLSSIRFSSRLHLTRTPMTNKQKKKKKKRFSLSLSRTPRPELDAFLGSSTPSPGPWVIEDSRRRMSFGATTMGDLSDVSDDEDSDGEEQQQQHEACLTDTTNIPLLQEYDTQSSCTSSLSSRASPWKNRSKWNRFESLSQDTGLALLEEQYNESDDDEDDEDADMIGIEFGGGVRSDIDMEQRVDEMRRACPQLMSKKKMNVSQTDVNTAAYKQLKISDFFQPQKLKKDKNIFSMSCGQLPRFECQPMEVSTPPRSRSRTRSLGDDKKPTHENNNNNNSVALAMTLSATDFCFETHSFQIASLTSTNLTPVVHGTGTLRSEASVWMNVPSHGRVDVIENTPPPPPRIPLLRCRSSPPMMSPSRTNNTTTKQQPPTFRTSPTCCLPVTQMTDDGCRCIAPQTMVDLLCGKYRDALDHFVVVDCRFTYEFMGGHVKNALHIQDRELLGHLYSANKGLGEKGRVVSWIFYCEFSQQRAPETATWFRKHDRTQHMEDYPNLSFPNVYILEGGFSRFWSLFSQHPDEHKLFSSNNYVSMWDRQFEISLKNHTKLRKELWSGGKGARKNKLRQRTGRSRSVCAGKRF